MTSSDTTRLTVPATVTLLAGQMSVNFTATLLDDHIIESGETPVTVTSHVENWTDGSATVNIIDDDRTMTVTLPASGWEGQTLSGTVQLGGTLTAPLMVSLSSSDTTQLTLPATVTIAAGSTSATFTATLVDNGLRTGPQTEQITATASGLPTATANVLVKDADVDHFTFTTISSPKLVGTAFSVTADACDVLGNLITVYNGTATLSGTGQGGTLVVSPSSVTFSSGVWTGNVTVSTVDPAATLHLSNVAGATGVSNAFTVKSQLQVISTTPAVGGLFTLPGPLTYDVNFSEAVPPSSVTTSSLVVSGISGATVTGATLLPGDTTAVFTIGGIGVEGTLTASIAAGAVTDQYGFPIKAFSATYGVDQPNPMQPAPFVSLAPAGGLALASLGNSATLFGATDQDEYAFFVQAGQTISAVATPRSPGVALTLWLGSGTPVVGMRARPWCWSPSISRRTGRKCSTSAAAATTAYTLSIYRNAAIEPLSGAQQPDVDRRFRDHGAVRSVDQHPGNPLCRRGHQRPRPQPDCGANHEHVCQQQRPGREHVRRDDLGQPDHRHQPGPQPQPGHVHDRGVHETGKLRGL